MGVLTRLLGLVCAMTLAGGCVPDLGDTSSLVGSPRVLAVRMVPAEAEEGDEVVLEALWSEPTGDTGAPIDWAVCRDRKALAELGPVSPRCLAPEGEWLIPAGMGLSVSTAIPDDACRLFGPSPPEAEEGAPAGRPVDPDPTGGFYVPVRVGAAGDDGAGRVSIAEVRVSCAASGTTREQAAELRRRYRLNESPNAALEVYRGDGAAAERDVEGTIPASVGERLSLVARWDVCPETDACGDGVCGIDESTVDCRDDCASPRGCGGAERYVRFDRTTRTVQSARESLSVSWLGTSGRFDGARSGVASDDRADGSGNGWVAPSDEGDVRLWAVVRDERGGTSWAEVVVRVRR